MTYKDAAVCYTTSGESDEAKGENDPVKNDVDDAQNPEDTIRDQARDPRREKPIQDGVAQPALSKRSRFLDILFRLRKVPILAVRGGWTTLEGGRVPLGALAAVSGPAVLVV